MTIKRRVHIAVSIEWERGRTSEGLGYALLRWREPTSEGRTTRKKASLGYVTPEEAEQSRREKEAALRLGLELPDFGRGYTVADLLVDYMEAIEESPVSSAHKDRVANDCEAIGRHLGRLLADALSAHHVGRYLALRSRERVARVRRRALEEDGAWAARLRAARVDVEGKSLASTTIRNEVATLRRSMKWGQDAGKITAHPVPHPHSKALPRDRRPPRRLTEDEARRLIAAAGDVGPYTELVEVFAWSGRRPVAVFGLRVGDCERLVERHLSRSQRLVYWRADKGGEATGWGPVTEPTYEAIRRRLEQLAGQPAAAPLWTTPTGKAWASTSWPKVFARIASGAEVNQVTTYDLRKHACAQILRRLGNPAEAILYTGHKTVEILLRNYAYALEGNAEEQASRIGWTPRPLELVPAAGGEESGPQNGPRPIGERGEDG